MITQDQQGPFQKAWYLKLNDPIGERALWLRFTVISSKNGFNRIAETWAVFFQRLPDREVKKIAIRQTYEISEFSIGKPAEIRIGECELTEKHTRGSIQSKGNSIQWDLDLIPGMESSFHMVPDKLLKTGLVKNSITTNCEDLLFSGTTHINGEIIHWKEAPGMQGHFSGNNSGRNWVWGHCNTFSNEEGKASQFIFEGLTAQTQIGPFVSPRLSSFYFYYQDQPYFFNTIRDLFFIKSKNSLNEWSFQADREGISFRGNAKAEYKNFAGLTFEDTKGSLLYCTHSGLSDIKIRIYRRGKLESAFHANGTGSFEIVSPVKNPYVPLLI